MPNKQAVKWRIDRTDQQEIEQGTHLYSSKKVAEKNKVHLEASRKDNKYELERVAA